MLLMHFYRRGFMQNAHAAGQNHAQKIGRPGGKLERKKPPQRYFVDGRVPPDVGTAQKRLALIKEELRHTSNLVNNAVDINTERHNSRKKFIEHTEKEISLLTAWIGQKTGSATTQKAAATAREKILETLSFLIDLDKKGLLLAKEAIVLDMLVDYGAQG